MKRIFIVVTLLLVACFSTARLETVSQSTQDESAYMTDLKKMLNEAPREEWFKDWYGENGFKKVWKTNPELQTQEWSVNPQDWLEADWNGPKKYNDTRRFMGDMDLYPAPMPTIQEVFKEFPYYVNIHFSDICSAIEVRFYIAGWDDNGARGRELRVPDWYYEGVPPKGLTPARGHTSRGCIALKMPSSLRDEEKEMQLFLLRRAYFQALFSSYSHKLLFEFGKNLMINASKTKNMFRFFGEKAVYDHIASKCPFNRFQTAPILTLPPMQDLVTTILAIQNDEKLMKQVICRFQNSDNESEQKLAAMLAEWSETLASR